MSEDEGRGPHVKVLFPRAASANEAPSELKIKIGRFDVTLVKKSMFDVSGVDAMIVPQFGNKPSKGGIAKRVDNGFGEHNSASFARVLEASNNGMLWDVGVVAIGDKSNALMFLNVITAGQSRTKAGSRVYEGVVNAIGLCMQKGLKHVVMPALSTGPEAFLEDRQSAAVIARAISDLDESTEEAPDLEITIAIYDPEPELANQRFIDFYNVLKSGAFIQYDVSEPGSRMIDETRVLRAAQSDGKLPEGIEIVASNGAVILAGQDLGVDPTQARENSPYRRAYEILEDGDDGPPGPRPVPDD